MSRYVSIDGATYFSTADTGPPSLDIANNLDMEADIALPNWASVPVNQAPVGYSPTVADRRYNMLVTSTQLFSFWYDTGNVQQNAGAAHGLTGSGRHTIRVTLENAAGTTTMSGYVDGGLVGSPTRTSGPLRSTSGDMDVGRNAGTQYLTGDIYGVEVLDGIGGPPVAVFDPDDIYEQVV